MRARYLGDHVDFVAWGISFPRGVFVTVTDPHAQKKIAGNREFQVENSDAEEVEFREVVSPLSGGSLHVYSEAPAENPVVLDAEVVAFESAPAREPEPAPQTDHAPVHVRGKPGPKPKAK